MVRVLSSQIGCWIRSQFHGHSYEQRLTHGRRSSGRTTALQRQRILRAVTANQLSLLRSRELGAKPSTSPPNQNLEVSLCPSQEKASQVRVAICTFPPPWPFLLSQESTSSYCLLATNGTKMFMSFHRWKISEYFQISEKF